MMSCSQFRRFLCLSAAALLFTCVFAAGAAEPAALLGDWEGAIETPAGDMPVYLHVTKSKDGKFGGSIDSPDQGAMGLPVTALTLAESSVHFEVKTVNGTFDGKINADLTAMSGTWKGVMGDMPLKLKRPAKK
jgi:hypothetical protein